MYQDKTEQLMDEYKGICGMIEEVAMKCRLFRSKVREIDDRKVIGELLNTLDQMDTDLDRYKQRIDEIYEELENEPSDEFQ